MESVKISVFPAGHRWIRVLSILNLGVCVEVEGARPGDTSCDRRRINYREGWRAGKDVEREQQYSRMEEPRTRERKDTEENQ